MPRDLSLIQKPNNQDVVNDLQQLSEDCDYGDVLNICDHLVCRVNHEQTQKRLIPEGLSLALSKALDIVLLLGSAIKHL